MAAPVKPFLTTSRILLRQHRGEQPGHLAPCTPAATATRGATPWGCEPGAGRAEPCPAPARLSQSRSRRPAASPLPLAPHLRAVPVPGAGAGAARSRPPRCHARCRRFPAPPCHFLSSRPAPGTPSPGIASPGPPGGGSPGPVPLRPAAGRAVPGAVRSRQLGGPDRHQQPHRHHREAPFQKQGFMNNFQHFFFKVSCKRLPSSIFFSTSRWRNVGSRVPFFPRRPIARTPRGSVSDVCQGHRHTSQTAVVDGMSGNQRESPAETPARHRSSHIWHTADGRCSSPNHPPPRPRKPHQHMGNIHVGEPKARFFLIPKLTVDTKAHC